MRISSMYSHWMAALVLCFAMTGPILAQAEPQSKYLNGALVTQASQVTDPRHWEEMLGPLVESVQSILAQVKNLTQGLAKWVDQFADVGQGAIGPLGQSFSEAHKMLQDLMQRLERELSPALKT